LDKGVIILLTATLGHRQGMVNPTVNLILVWAVLLAFTVIAGSDDAESRS